MSGEFEPINASSDEAARQREGSRKSRELEAENIRQEYLKSKNTGYLPPTPPQPENPDALTQSQRIRKSKK